MLKLSRTETPGNKNCESSNCYCDVCALWGFPLFSMGVQTFYHHFTDTIGVYLSENAVHGSVSTSWSSFMPKRPMIGLQIVVADGELRLHSQHLLDVCDRNTTTSYLFMPKLPLINPLDNRNTAGRLAEGSNVSSSEPRHRVRISSRKKKHFFFASSRWSYWQYWKPWPRWGPS